jgi:hypothetical protein
LADQDNNSKALEIGRQKAGEVTARRVAARAARAAALAVHPSPQKFQVSVKSLATPAAAASTIETAGYLVAAGDSWFDYPVHDVLTMLEDNYGYNVESSAHAGDPIEAMAYHDGQLDKFARCLDKVIGHGAAPKAVLLSGGGDDIAGDEFGMLINNATSPIAGWNAEVVDGVINQRIATAYRVMLGAITNLCQTNAGKVVPVLVHGYDHPVPDGRGFLGGWLFLPGPWLKPGFQEKLFEDDLPVTTQMMSAIIDRFNDMLAALVKEPGFEHVHYVDLRGTLSNALPDAYKASWANELHPSGNGFKAVADRFAGVLRTLP